MTVREQIETIRREIRDTDVQPDRAADLLVKLTALLGNCFEEIRVSEMAFHQVLLQHLDSEKAANRARVRAQITPEYARAREAKDTKELVVELCRSLKYLLKMHEESMRLAR